MKAKEHFELISREYNAISKGKFYVEALKLFLKPLMVKRGFTVLDVGCGTGATTVQLAKSVGKAGKVYAVDVSEKMLKIARKNLKTFSHRVIFQLRDAADLRYRDNTFDTVVASGVVYWLEEPEVGMREMVRVLKKGGKIGISAPTSNLTKEKVERLVQVFQRNWNQPSVLMKCLCPDIGKSSVYSKSDLRRLLRNIGPNGLQPFEIRHLLSWPNEVAPYASKLFMKSDLADMMQKVGLTNIEIVETLDRILLGAYGVK